MEKLRLIKAEYHWSNRKDIWFYFIGPTNQNQNKIHLGDPILQNEKKVLRCYYHVYDSKNKKHIQEILDYLVDDKCFGVSGDLVLPPNYFSSVRIFYIAEERLKEFKKELKVKNLNVLYFQKKEKDFFGIYDNKEMLKQLFEFGFWEEKTKNK